MLSDICCSNLDLSSLVLLFRLCYHFNHYIFLSLKTAIVVATIERIFTASNYQCMNLG